MATMNWAKRKSSALVENIKTIVYAGLIALVVRTVAFEPFNIPSGSMLPTLQIGDYLFVAKYSYGFSRYSLPFGWPPFPGRIFGQPAASRRRRGVQVSARSVDRLHQAHRRAAGRYHPGARWPAVHQRPGLPAPAGGRLQVNDEGIRTIYRLYIETLPERREAPGAASRPTRAEVNNTQVYSVPPDHVFAMGDNRDNSADSRFMNGVGYVPVENLVGRAELDLLLDRRRVSLVGILGMAVRDPLGPAAVDPLMTGTD